MSQPAVQQCPTPLLADDNDNLSVRSFGAQSLKRRQRTATKRPSAPNSPDNQTASTQQFEIQQEQGQIHGQVEVVPDASRDADSAAYHHQPSKDMDVSGDSKPTRPPRSPRRLQAFPLESGPSFSSTTTPPSAAFLPVPQDQHLQSHHPPTRKRTMSSGEGSNSRPMIQQLQSPSRGRETQSDSGSINAKYQRRGVSLPRQSIHRKPSGYVSQTESSTSGGEPSPLTPNALSTLPDLYTHPTNAHSASSLFMRTHRRGANHHPFESRATHDSGTSSSLYPPSSLTDAPTLESEASSESGVRSLRGQSTRTRARRHPNVHDPSLIQVDDDIEEDVYGYNDEKKYLGPGIDIADDVSYRLRLLVKNNYYLPPAHSKPYATDFASDFPPLGGNNFGTANANGMGAPRSLGFLDIFKRGKKSPVNGLAGSPNANSNSNANSNLNPNANIARGTPDGINRGQTLMDPFATGPMLRTTADSSTLSMVGAPRATGGNTVNGVNGLVRPRTAPTERHGYGYGYGSGMGSGQNRVVVVRECLDDIREVAKKSEVDIKAKERQRVKRGGAGDAKVVGNEGGGGAKGGAGDGLGEEGDADGEDEDAIVDPTDVVDVPLGSNSLFGAPGHGQGNPNLNTAFNNAQHNTIFAQQSSGLTGLGLSAAQSVGADVLDERLVGSLTGAMSPGSSSFGYGYGYASLHLGDLEERRWRERILREAVDHSLNGSSILDGLDGERMGSPVSGVSGTPKSPLSNSLGAVANVKAKTRPRMRMSDATTAMTMSSSSPGPGLGGRGVGDANANTNLKKLLIGQKIMDRAELDAKAAQLESLSSSPSPSPVLGPGSGPSLGLRANNAPASSSPLSTKPISSNWNPDVNVGESKIQAQVEANGLLRNVSERLSFGISSSHGHIPPRVESPIIPPLMRSLAPPPFKSKQKQSNAKAGGGKGKTRVEALRSRTLDDSNSTNHSNVDERLGEEGEEIRRRVSGSSSASSRSVIRRMMSEPALPPNARVSDAFGRVGFGEEEREKEGYAGESSKGVNVGTTSTTMSHPQPPHQLSTVPPSLVRPQSSMALALPRPSMSSGSVYSQPDDDRDDGGDGLEESDGVFLTARETDSDQAYAYIGHDYRGDDEHERVPNTSTSQGNNSTSTGGESHFVNSMTTTTRPSLSLSISGGRASEDSKYRYHNSHGSTTYGSHDRQLSPTVSAFHDPGADSNSNSMRRSVRDSQSSGVHEGWDGVEQQDERGGRTRYSLSTGVVTPPPRSSSVQAHHAIALPPPPRPQAGVMRSRSRTIGAGTPANANTSGATGASWSRPSTSGSTKFSAGGGLAKLSLESIPSPGVRPLIAPPRESTESSHASPSNLYSNSNSTTTSPSAIRREGPSLTQLRIPEPRAGSSSYYAYPSPIAFFDEVEEMAHRRGTIAGVGSSDDDEEYYDYEAEEDEDEEDEIYRSAVPSMGDGSSESPIGSSSSAILAAQADALAHAQVQEVRGSTSREVGVVTQDEALIKAALADDKDTHAEEPFGNQDGHDEINDDDDDLVVFVDPNTKAISNAAINPQSAPSIIRVESSSGRVSTESSVAHSTVGFDGRKTSGALGAALIGAAAVGAAPSASSATSSAKQARSPAALTPLQLNHPAFSVASRFGGNRPRTASSPKSPSMGSGAGVGSGPGPLSGRPRTNSTVSSKSWQQQQTRNASVNVGKSTEALKLFDGLLAQHIENEQATMRRIKNMSKEPKS